MKSLWIWIASLASLPLVWGDPSDTPFKVISLKGNIEYRAPESLSIINLRVHHLLHPNGKLRLDKGEQVVLESLRGDLLTFKDDAYIKLSDFIQDDGDSQTLIDVYRGHGRFKVKKLSEKSHFKVRTPRFVTSVRGTEFSVQDDQVSVLEGEVVVQPTANMDTTLAISAGETATVESTGEVEVQNTESSSSAVTTTTTQTQSEQEEQVSSEVTQQQEQSEAERLFQIKVNINAHD